jgi:hypothetical protein
MLEWEEELRQEAVIPKNAFFNFVNIALRQVYLNERDEVLAVSTNFELTQYLRKKSKVYLRQFDILE